MEKGDVHPISSALLVAIVPMWSSSLPGPESQAPWCDEHNRNLDLNLWIWISMPRPLYTICTLCDAISHPWRIYYQTSFMLRRFIPGTKQDRRKACTYWNLICVSLWCSTAHDVLFVSFVGSDTPRPLLPSLWRLWFTTFRVVAGESGSTWDFTDFSLSAIYSEGLLHSKCK